MSSPSLRCRARSPSLLMCRALKPMGTTTAQMRKTMSNSEGLGGDLEHALLVANSHYQEGEPDGQDCPKRQGRMPEPEPAVDEHVRSVDWMTRETIGS